MLPSHRGDRRRALHDRAAHDAQCARAGQALGGVPDERPQRAGRAFLKVRADEIEAEKENADPGRQQRECVTHRAAPAERPLPGA